MPEKRFPMFVKWEKRQGSNSAWISVGHPDRGPHFQCDYDGCMEEGPVRIHDFREDPPDWVVQELGLI